MQIEFPTSHPEDQQFRLLPRLEHMRYVTDRLDRLPTVDEVRGLLETHPAVVVSNSHDSHTYGLLGGELVRAGKIERVQRDVAGQSVTFDRWFLPSSPDGWPTLFWQRAGHGVGHRHDRHESLEGAVAQAVEDAHVATFEHRTLTRADYDSECARAGAQPLEDAQIARSAGGEFYRPEYPVQTEIHHMLLPARRRGIEAERPAPDAANRPQATASPQFTCNGCGRQFPQVLAMTSNLLGAVCPDCYDRPEASGTL